VFCAKSAEAVEKKGVEFLESARNDKRVRKSMKTEKLDVGGRDKTGRESTGLKA
jgi:hypothetical protein